MLALKLGQIKAARERFEQVYQPDAFEQSHDDFRFVSPVSLVFDIDRDKQQFRLAGRVLTRLELRCSRCLEPFAWPVDGTFDLRYQPLTQNSGEGEHEIEEDDLSTAFYENDEIDLGQLIEEQCVLSLTMKPLCRTDCQGLCPTCGTNRNRGMCDCKTEWDDPRLAPLRTLKRES